MPDVDLNVNRSMRSKFAPANTTETPLENEWITFSADPLSQIIDQLHLNSMFCAILRSTPPFARPCTGTGLQVMIVTQGSFYVQPLDGCVFDPVLAGPGDVVVMPHGQPYRVAYPPDVPLHVDIPFLFVRDSSHPGVDDIEWLGMACQLDDAHRDLFLEFLPPVVHLKKAGLTRWLRTTIDLFVAEHRGSVPGRGAVLRRLAEIVIVQAVRLWIGQLTAGATRWHQAFRDERIARAVLAIHRDPGSRWSVDSLAHHAGMSRTVFATQFKTLVGESPMRYVSRRRMHQAAELLEQNRASLKSVVAATGYQSAAAFRASFKRRFGQRPNDYRRRLSGS
jgi:AraC-like DNA-binding protein